MFFWILLIALFTLLRCIGHWSGAAQSASRSTHQRMCMYTCQETVHLSCGVVTNAKIFQNRQYRQLLIVHGVTIIPMIAGIYFGGLLYGDFLLNSQEPLIDSIEQLEQSGLYTVYPENFGIDVDESDR